MAKRTTGERAASTGSNRRVGTKLLAAQARGHAADAKGLRFEQNVSAYYDKQGWRVRPRVKLVGREFDLVGRREGDWGSEEYLLVECKDKQRVTPSDVLAFLAKLKKFDDRWPGIAKAVLAHTGELPRDGRDAARASPIEVAFKKF